MSKMVGVLWIAASASMAKASLYSLDDGTAEYAIGVTSPSSQLWLNQFPVTGGDNIINSVGVAFGEPSFSQPGLTGQPVTILLYEDADGGDTQDAVLKWSFDTTIPANHSTNTFNFYPTGGISVSNNFLRGCLLVAPPGPLQSPSALDDESDPAMSNRSFVGLTFDGQASIDPANLAAIPAGQYDVVENLIGIPGNWLVRAEAVPEPGTLALLAVGAVAGLRGRRRA